MANHERLHGIYTPNLVPLDEQGEINETVLREYIDWLIAKGVHGLYPNGSTGEPRRPSPGSISQVSSQTHTQAGAPFNLGTKANHGDGWRSQRRSCS